MLLHATAPKCYVKKTGEKVNETVGILADASEGSRVLQFFEAKLEGDLLEWKPGIVREIEITEMQQLFSGRLLLKSFNLADI